MAEYVAKKSAWSVLSFWKIISCILIIPIFIILFKILSLKTETISFYEDKIVWRKGILNTTEKKFSFQGVYSVSLSQKLGGKMFNYGDISADFVGNHDLKTNSIKNPKKLAEYLETKIVQKSEVQRIVH